MEEAQEALGSYLSSLIEDEEEINSASDIKSIVADDDSFTDYEGWCLRKRRKILWKFEIVRSGLTILFLDSFWGEFPIGCSPMYNL